MSNMTLISQRSALGLSAPARPTVAFAGAPAAFSTCVNPGHMNTAWLGGVVETVCVSEKYDTKRIATGRLSRMLT